MALPTDYIERLKAANPIAEVIGTYVPLKRQGRDYVCLCPFHGEKTPSFYVHPDREFFKCFGCNVGGDVITFVMKYENYDYIDAVKKLADRAGMPLPEDDGYKKRSDDRKRLYEMNKTAARFFHEQLKKPEGRGCLEYLINTRRLSGAVINKYGMGFAPKSWTALKNHMLSEGYTEQELIDGSLITRSSKGGSNTFDFFVNRAMFPFIDITGHIVGFGGRALDNEDKRKYLNSRDTACYNKNRFLFSMNFAKNESVKSKQVLLCEGNLDVISLNMHGFENAVASCGTALTPEQAKQIASYAEKVVICYDSDEAGQKATQRAIGILRNAGLKTSVLRMSGAKDPDEYINKFGEDHFKHLLTASEGAVEFQLEKCKEGLDPDNDADKFEYLKRACRVIAGIYSPIEREVYVSKLAREQNVDKDRINEEIKILLNRGRREQLKKADRQIMQRVTNTNPRTNPDTKEVRSEKNLMYFVRRNPDMLEEILKKITPNEFITDFNKRVFNSLVLRMQNDLDFSSSSFYDEFQPEEVDRISNIFDTDNPEADNPDCIDDYIANIKAYNQSVAERERYEKAEEVDVSWLEEMRKKHN